MSNYEVPAIVEEAPPAFMAMAAAGTFKEYMDAMASPDESAVEVVPASQLEQISPSEPVYSTSGNTWIEIPAETIAEIAGGMDQQTAYTFRQALTRFIDISEASSGDSAFSIAEALLRLGINNVDPGFGSISLGSIVRVGEGDAVTEIRNNEGNVVALCMTSHFGGIRICSVQGPRQGVPLGRYIQSKEGPFPVIDDGLNISAATVQLGKFARYGPSAMSVANDFLAGIGSN